MPNSTLKERRKLKFTSIDDITADAGKLSQAERNKKLRQLGNWTLGQACGHIAGWIDFGFDGTPAKFSWLARLLARGARKKYIYGGLIPGGRLPRIPGGTLATDPLTTEDGLNRLKRACTRLKASTPTRKHFIFGKLKPDEWKNLQMRHAELHLSFFRVD
jgi:hypothetical protein